MQSIDPIIRSIHELARLRHFDVEPARISVVLNLALSESQDGRPNPGEPNDPPGVIHPWTASIHLGGGKWGSLAGEGDSPTVALLRLHSIYLDAHKAVDGSRSSALTNAERLHAAWAEPIRSDKATAQQARAAEREDARRATEDEAASQPPPESF